LDSVYPVHNPVQSAHCSVQAHFTTLIVISDLPTAMVRGFTAYNIKGRLPLCQSRVGSIF